MHADEFHIDADLVGRLIAAQFPPWAHLPIDPVQPAGTVSAIYRLGDEMAVRLPRIATWLPELRRDDVWLRRFAPLLPLTIPTTVAVGEPDEGFPFPWSVQRWLDGNNAAVAPIGDHQRAAEELARFVAALHRIDTGGWPPPPPHVASRGVTLSSRDAATREWIATPPSPFDPSEVTAAWEVDLAVPTWSQPPVWIHGDLQPLNLLTSDGRLTAVLDWEGFGLGDPATDVMAAWSLFSNDGRAAFRAALGVDDATWQRGRGWALSVWVAVLPYYAERNPTFSAIACQAIVEILTDHRGSI